MKFRHKVEKTNINGLKEFSVNYFLCDALLIGRGSACHIRLSSRSVGLTHAKLTLVDDALMVEAGDPECEVRVNDSITTRAILKVKDRVKIGDTEFITFFDGTYWGFHEIVVERAEEEDSVVLSKQLKQLDVAQYYPRFVTFSALLMVTVFLFCFADPFLGRNQKMWSAGPVANAHRMIENDCRACHSTDFKRVKDEQCLACHSLSEHAAGLTAVVAMHPDAGMRCADCHKDHNGDNTLREKDSRLCTQCHAQLGDFSTETDHPDVTRFDRHPEFAVRIKQYSTILDPGQPSGATETVSLKKVSLGDPTKLIDTARIKLNHRKHLQPNLRSATGPVQLSCGDCHQFTDDLRTVKPITFESHCTRCHTLGFDERLVDKSVPHGDPDTVYNFLYAEYAKLFLETEKKGARQDFVKRYRPGQQPEAEQPNLDFTKAFVEQESRKAEGELFRRTACFLCHDVRDLGSEVPGKSTFSVLKPDIPERWMPAARFDHGAHQETTCESCHRNIRNSAKTTDVNLPVLKDCTVCHREGKVSGKISSECTTCHSYHDSRLLVDSKKRPVREVLALLNK